MYFKNKICKKPIKIEAMPLFEHSTGKELACSQMEA